MILNLKNLNNVKISHAIPFLAIGGLVSLFAFSGNHPLLQNLDNFVLFGQEEVKVEKEVQVSSGDIGSNKEINIEKDAVINGNLFSNGITIDKNTIINGNISYNELEIHKETQILGTKTTPILLPVANLSEISDFPIGTQDFKFTDQNNTLPSGNYRNITLEKDSRLVLSGGIYNLNKLELKENSTLIFNAPTTINIQFKLKGQNHISVLPDKNLKPQDLTLNYKGENDQEKDEKENKEDKEDNNAKPIEFGQNSFLNFKLISPKAKVHLGEYSTFRGQILARKIKIEKNSILSREEVFAKESDPTKIVEEQGVKFVVNEIVVLLVDGATFADAQAIADLVNGTIIGFISMPPIYKIEVKTTTVQDLNNKIQIIKNSNNPLIIEIVQNLISQST